MSSAHQIAEIADLTNNIIELEKDGKKVLALNPKALNIVWGGKASKSRYWHYSDVKDGETSFQVVELLGVYWLEIKGKLDLKRLTAGAKYKFYVKIKLTQDASGWEKSSVKFMLQLPGKAPKSAAVYLPEHLDADQWVDVPDGGLDFEVPEDTSTGMLSFAMYEIEGGEWKKGLFIKQVYFEPLAELNIVPLSLA